MTVLINKLTVSRFSIFVLINLNVVGTSLLQCFLPIQQAFAQSSSYSLPTGHDTQLGASKSGDTPYPSVIPPIKIPATKENWREDLPAKPIGHLKGKQGKPLTVQSIPVNQLLPKQLIPHVLGVSDFKEKFQSNAIFNDSEIPICKNSLAEIKKVAIHGSYAEPQVLIDNIYLDSKFLDDSRLTKDYRDLFGPQVTLSLYERGEPSPGNGLLKATGIPCLPYRIRLTSDSIIKLSGRDALKNYETPAARGKFHPLVAEVIRSFR